VSQIRIPDASGQRGLVLAAACLCQLMVVLDISVVNVALPSIATNLHFATGTLSWVVNAYTLVFGGLLLLGGRIADFIGHRVAMFAGLGLFGVASLAGGLAQTPAELIAARAGQGLAAAVLAPLSLTVIMVGFPEGPARTRALTAWSTVAGAGSALGVLMGGLLTQWLSWRWVLLVNIPIVIAVVILAAVSIRDTRTHRRPRLDMTGAALITLALVSLVNGAVRADAGWGSRWVLGSFAVAAVAGAAFVVWEGRAAEPLVRFGMLRSRPVAVANIVSLLQGSLMTSGFYFASLFLQDLLGFNPLAAGAAFLPFCVGMIAGAALSGRLVSRLGPRTVIATGLGLAAIGMFLFGQMDAHSTFLDGFMGPSIIASIGLGLCIVANTTLATTGIAPQEAGLASGLVNTSRQIGGSIGLAALATVATSATGGHGPRLSSAGYDAAFLVAAAFAVAAAIVVAVFAPTRAAATGAAPVSAKQHEPA